MIRETGEEKIWRQNHMTVGQLLVKFNQVNTHATLIVQSVLAVSYLSQQFSSCSGKSSDDLYDLYTFLHWSSSLCGSRSSKWQKRRYVYYTDTQISWVSPCSTMALISVTLAMLCSSNPSRSPLSNSPRSTSESTLLMEAS